MLHLYIVGAGASADFGLPLGEGLKEQISNLINFKFENGHLKSGNAAIREAIMYGCRQNTLEPADHNAYFRAGRLIAESMPLAPSIDNFVETHKADPYVTRMAKIAIVTAILNSERSSKLWRNPATDRAIDFKSASTSWLGVFFKQLIEGADLEKIKQRLSNTKFIVFNYDRCIEHFLYNAIQKYLNVSAQIAAETLKELSVTHPYGSLGPLPWQENAINAIEYGGDADWQELLTLSERINTFSEGLAFASASRQNIRYAVQHCSISSFIGFAYAPINMRLLREVCSDISRIKDQGSNYSTVYNISQSNSADIRGEIADFFSIEQSQVNLLNAKSAELFESFSRRFWRE